MAGLVPHRRGNPCPQCGQGDGWCFASADARYTFCRRVQGEHAVVREDVRGQEYYLTRNDRMTGVTDAETPVLPLPEWRETPADAETRDRVYRALLGELGLSGEHTRRLRERGLPGRAIELGSYATMPAADGERAAVVRNLLRSIGASYLLDVPGFYKRNGAKDTRLAGTPGILIPVRNDAGLVVACLIRVDDARDGGGKYRWLSSPPDTIGCGPGLCIHVPPRDGFALDVVRVTEGPLKADIATILSGVLTIGLPGVGAWKLAVPALRRLKPKKVLVALDVDARTNPHVARPLARITNALREEGYEVAIEWWPSSAGKGIDDVLAAGRASSIRIVEQAGIATELRAIQSGAGIEPTDSQPRPDAAGEPANTEERKSQAKALLELAASADYFHSPEGKMFADVRVDGRRQTWAISSASFRQWLALRMYRTHDKPAGAQAMSDAIAVLEARARFDGPERSVLLRVAEGDGRVYVDLANDAWEAVEITPLGWRVVSEPPIRFRRTNGMRPLPRPVEGGSLDELRPLLNLESDDDWTLTVAWLLGALRPRGPYPLAVLQGEQGSAKSTTARVLRELIDPNTSPLRAKPRDVQELMITAINGWIVCYDNLSGLSLDLSDGLCRLATGGGFSTRELYSDTSEVLLEAQRPVILTGIDAITTRADLADRSLILTLPPIPEGKRMREADFWSAFEALRPRVLGALFSAVSGALSNSGRDSLATLPRMADFAEWVTSAERALDWRPRTFMAAYTRNRGEAAVGAVDADPVAAAVRRLVQDRGDWEGTATDLLQALGDLAGDAVTHTRAWPKGPRPLSERLQRVAPALRTGGIDVVRDRTNSSRLLRLRRVDAGAQRDPRDAPSVGDASNVVSVTQNTQWSPQSDAGDAHDALLPFTEGSVGPSATKDTNDQPPSNGFADVLENPVVAMAIKTLEPESIRVRLADGRQRVWTTPPTDEMAPDPSSSHPTSGDGSNHERKPAHARPR